MAEGLSDGVGPVAVFGGTTGILDGAPLCPKVLRGSGRVPRPKECAESVAEFLGEGRRGAAGTDGDVH